MSKKRTVNISKTLSWLLRHGGIKEGLTFRDDGYVLVDDVLTNENMVRFGTTYHDVKNIVADNDKQRFQLLEEKKRIYVRATQGHSMKFEKMGYKKINSKDDLDTDTIIHGTYYKVWPLIKKEGLKTMDRTHIHFAKGLPGSKGMISGMRGSCQILIYLDVQKCLADGIQLEESENGVILTKGVDGVLDPKYFEKVVDVKTGNLI